MYLKRNAVKAFLFGMATNSVNLSKNYYKVLEVDAGCDQKVIKNSYLKLVKTHHPDVNPNGKQKFTEVQEAYQILSDKQLKIYYDQNNHLRNGSTSRAEQKQNPRSSSNFNKTNSGHQYYTHRTYQSDNPQDYYSGYRKSQNQNDSKKRKQKSHEQQQDEQEVSSSQSGKKPFDKQQKYARSQASYDEFRRQQKNHSQQMYKGETAEEKQMRDKLKAMRGFTSSYNVLWGRNHIRYTDVMPNYERQKKKQEQIRKLMPQKVRKLYDKIMDTIDKLAQK